MTSVVYRTQGTPCVPASNGPHKKPEFCPELGGTILRIAIPPGFTINLLGLIELTSPSGICLIIRLPFIDSNVNGILDTIRKAGGTVEVLPQAEVKPE